MLKVPWQDLTIRSFSSTCRFLMVGVRFISWEISLRSVHTWAMVGLGRTTKAQQSWRRISHISQRWSSSYLLLWRHLSINISIITRLFRRLLLLHPILACTSASTYASLCMSSCTLCIVCCLMLCLLLREYHNLVFTLKQHIYVILHAFVIVLHHSCRRILNLYNKIFLTLFCLRKRLILYWVWRVWRKSGMRR